MGACANGKSRLMDGLGQRLLLSKEEAATGWTQQALSQPEWELQGGGTGQAARCVHVLLPSAQGGHTRRNS